MLSNNYAMPISGESERQEVLSFFESHQQQGKKFCVLPFNAKTDRFEDSIGSSNFPTFLDVENSPLGFITTTPKWEDVNGCVGIEAIDFGNGNLGVHFMTGGVDFMVIREDAVITPQENDFHDRGRRKWLGKSPLYFPKKAKGGVVFDSLKGEKTLAQAVESAIDGKEYNVIEERCDARSGENFIDQLVAPSNPLSGILVRSIRLRAAQLEVANGAKQDVLNVFSKVARTIPGTRVSR